MSNKRCWCGPNATDSQTGRCVQCDGIWSDEPIDGYCYYCGPLSERGGACVHTRDAAKLALFDQMREVLRELHRAGEAVNEAGTGILAIALQYQLEEAETVLAEADALAEKEASDGVYEAAYKAYELEQDT